MTRPPAGVSFAQFFPNAPKVRAEAQEQLGQGQPAYESGDAVKTAPEAFPDASSAATAAFTPTSSACPIDAPLTLLDDRDASVGDIPSTVGSATSHTSSSSSVFSSALKLTPSSAPAEQTADQQSTTLRGPSLIAPASLTSRSDMPPSNTSHHGAGHSHNQGKSRAHDAKFSHRVPARDPSTSVKGMKCIYDPVLDRLRNKNAAKGGKVIYEEFGLVCTVFSAIVRRLWGVLSCRN